MRAKHGSLQVTELERSDPDRTKPCSRCGEEAPLSTFRWKSRPPSTDARGTLVSTCNRCKNTQRNKWRANNPDKAKAEWDRGNRTKAFRRHGIHDNHYETMYEAQAGCCAICGTHADSLTRSLHVDHDHVTGEIRELLCHFCNTGLGAFKDDTTRLESAIRYLQKHKDAVPVTGVPI